MVCTEKTTNDLRARTARTITVALAFVCPVLLAARVCAQPAPEAARTHSTAQELIAKKAAKKLADEGEERMKSGDFAEAYELFRQADEQFHAPTFVIRQARAKVKAGALVEARDIYQRVLAEKLAKNAPGPFIKAQMDAKKELAGVEKRIPFVIITLVGAPPNVRVKVDGTAIPAERLGQQLAQDPGLHTFVASVEGGETITSVVALREGKQVPVELVFPKPKTPPPPEVEVGLAAPVPLVKPPFLGVPNVPYGALELLSTAPLLPDAGNAYDLPAVISLTTGCAALTAGVVTLVVWAQSDADIKSQCNGTKCPMPLKPDADATVALGRLGLSGVITGAAGIGGAILLWRLGRSTGGSPKKAVSLVPRIDGLTVRGNF